MKDYREKILHNIGILFFGRLIAIIISFSVNIVLTRQLTVSEFGEFYFLIVYLGYFFSLIDLGTNAIAVREIAAKPANAGKILGSFVSLKLLSAPFVFAFCVVLSLILGHSFDSTIQQLVMLGGISILVFPLNTLEVAFQAQHRNIFSVITNISSNITYLAGITICTYYGLELWTLALVLAGHHILRAFLHWLFFTKNIPSSEWKLVWRINWQFIKPLLKESALLGLASFIAVLYFNADTLVLERLQSSQALGIFGAAHKILGFLLFLPSILIIPLYPVLSEYYKHKRRDYVTLVRKTFGYLMLIGIPLAIGLSLLSKNIIILLFTEKFAESGNVLTIIAWATPAVFGGGLLSFAIVSAEKTKLWLITVVGGLIISFAANLALVPFLSYIGASYAKIVTEYFIYLSCWIAFYMITGSHPVKKDLFWKLLVVCLPVAAAAILMRDIHIGLAIGTLTAIYLITMFLLERLNNKSTAE